METILTGAEGRYLTKIEQQQIREYVGSLDARFVAQSEVETKERQIVSKALERTMKAYPDVQEKYRDAESKGMEDYSLTLRYATLAMVKNDPKFLDEALLAWFKTILDGLGFSRDFIRDSYRHLAESAQGHLSDENWLLLGPYLDQVVQRLVGEQARAD